jgi:hypothetical protein
MSYFSYIAIASYPDANSDKHPLLPFALPARVSSIINHYRVFRVMYLILGAGSPLALEATVRHIGCRAYGSSAAVSYQVFRPSKLSVYAYYIVTASLVSRMLLGGFCHHAL